MQTILSFFYLFVMLAMTQVSAGEIAQASGGKVAVTNDLPYLGSDRQEKLDLYAPAHIDKGQRFPGVVIIHGGGWVGGDKRQLREQKIGKTLAAAGYVCVSINYKLSHKRPDETWQPSWPTNLHDCKRAVRYLRKNADRLHVDPDHIGVIGGSAGAHLALLAGLTDPESGLDPAGPDEKISCRVQAVVDLYGWSDTGKDGHRILGGTLEEVPELFRQAAPTTHASADDPPVLILHGTADTTIPVYHAHHLEKAFQKAGVEFETRIVIGAPHSFHLKSEQADLRPLVLQFFDKHLKSTKP